MCVSASVRVCVLVLVTCAAAYDQPYDILYSPVERGALDDCYNATTRLPQVRTLTKSFYPLTCRLRIDYRRPTIKEYDFTH